MSLRADLHVHTYYSDGQYSPADIARLSSERGLQIVAVTDHDGCLAYDELHAACKPFGVTAVRGIEVSAYSGDVKVHTLGYCFKDTPAWLKFVNSLREGSFARAEDILKKLKACGVEIPFEEASAQRYSDEMPIHSIHIARAAVKLGYVRSPYDFFAEYMMAGRPAFSTVARPTPEIAVAAIKEAGGISSLAHPGRVMLDKEGLTALVKKLKCFGLDGIEAVYSTHTAADEERFKNLAKKYKLLITGGSDSHYAEGRKKVGTPAFYPDAHLLEKLINP